MTRRRLFRDRADAGRALAAEIRLLVLHEPVVLALPRGGVPVAFEVARAIGADLDVLVVRKLGVPYHPELAFGAIASGGVCVMNKNVLRRLPGLTDSTIQHIVANESTEIARRDATFRGGHAYPSLANRDVLLVDDGLATGATMLAAVQTVRQSGPRRILVAVPVGAPDAVSRIVAEADDIICLHAPKDFVAVGLHYERFDQTTDEEVRRLIQRRRTPAPGALTGRTVDNLPSESVWDSRDARRQAAKKHLDEKLDEALAATFPASDPIELSGSGVM